MHARDIEMRGDPGAHQVGQHDDLAGVLGVGVGIDQRRELVERIAPERGRADILEQALGDGLVAGMAVNVDETRHRHEAASIDLDVGSTRIARTDVQEATLREGDIDALPIGMRIVVIAASDGPGAVADDSDGEGMTRAD